MQLMRLGTQSLPPTEVGLVRMLLRLYGNDGQFNWSYADVPPYDALLVDAAAFNPENPPLEGPQAQYVRTIARGLDDPDALHRPLNADKLRSWLNEMEKSISDVPRMPADTPDETPPRLFPATTAEQPTVEQTTVDPSHLLTPQAPSLPTEGGPRFRLARWPHQVILRKDPARIRMATLLSRRALNVRDLVALTGFDPQMCHVFMQVLQASSLLTPVPPDAVSQTAGSVISHPQLRAPGKSKNLSPGASAMPRSTRSLISGLRELLGL